MVFKTSREVLFLPTMLGALNVVFGGGLLLYRAVNGKLALDFDAVGAGVLLFMGSFFLQVALKLRRYQIEVTDAWLGVGHDAATSEVKQMKWPAITRLTKQEMPGKGRKPPSIVYRVYADKRELAFTSLLFKDHENLASLIAEHSGKSWEPPAAPST